MICISLTYIFLKLILVFVIELLSNYIFKLILRFNDVSIHITDHQDQVQHITNLKIKPPLIILLYPIHNGRLQMKVLPHHTMTNPM